MSQDCLIPSEMWDQFQLGLRAALYSGTLGGPTVYVKRRVRYDDHEAKACIRRIAMFDIRAGITPKQGLGLEIVT